jgi:hypothetical protein
VGDNATPAASGRAHNVAAFLSAFFNSLIVWIAAMAVISLINIWLEKLRSGKLLKTPVGWVRNGSEVGFTLAAVVINAITVVALARLIGGAPIGNRRVTEAALGYSIFFASLFTLIGIGFEDLL